MLIFFGFRSTKIGQQNISGQTVCPHCESQNSFIATVFGTYFHIFWIPIISTGKTITVECSHCKKTYNKKDLPSELKNAVSRTVERSKIPKTIWHNLGCFIILGIVGLMFITTVIALVVNGLKDEEAIIEKAKEEDKVIVENSWRKYLNNDMYKADYFPNIETDPISYALKQCLDPTSINLDTENTSFRTRVNDKKILIIVESRSIDSLSSNQREVVYNKIDTCLDQILRHEAYDRYIGVCKSNYLHMQKSPTDTVKDSTANTAELLKEFYFGLY